MIFTSSTGVQREIDLDVDAILAYEAEHPEWSFFEMMDSLGDKPKMATFDLMARFVGFNGLSDLVGQGFSVKDLSAAFENSPMWGFTDSDNQESA